ncbi:MAG: glycosyltransferase [Endomicrobiaceae bacterium]|nr:glycosyltransferase [Endomicrobiaceae bacterium]
MDNQQFSLLMSVYAKDNPKWFKEAIESIINQTVKPMQIVLVIDGPINQELQDVIYLYNQNVTLKFDILKLEKNSGLGIALQKGLKICKYPLVARMDSDDISLPSRFELQLKEFNSNSNLSILSAYIQEIDCNTKSKLNIRKVPLTDAEIKKYIKTRSPFNHPSVMFKKENVLKAGNYQEFHFMEDYYLWIRMVKNNFEMKNIPDILLQMRVNPNLYSRRGGYKYFISNKAICDEMLKLNLITYPYYLFNIAVRFTTQVLMPNYLRKFFYKKVLR